MKDISKKQEFTEHLSYIIKKYGLNIKIQKKILEQLKNKIQEIDITRLLSGNNQPQFLTDMHLLLFSQAFYYALKETEGVPEKDYELINPHILFTENEFNEALHVSLIKNRKKDSITFHNVIRVPHKKFGYMYRIPMATVEEITYMADNNITNYNYKAQREAIKKPMFGQEIKIPKIFPEKQEKITEKILNNDYYPVDTIIINVLKNGSDKLDFNPTLNESIGDLTLYKVEGSTNDIIDGANRQQAIVKANLISKEENIPLNTFFKIDILNVPLLNSNDCITQINEQTPISNDRIQILDTSKYMLMAKDINIYQSNEPNILYQKLGEGLNEYNELNKISTIQVFANGLEEHFKDILNKNNPISQRNVFQYQIQFFNEWFGNLFDYLENVTKTKKETVLFDINMFYCYIYIARKLYDVYNKDKIKWENLIQQITTFFDFKKTNQKWEKLKTTGKFTPTAKKDLLKYIDNQLANAIHV